jgi:hypothetical protein
MYSPITNQQSTIIFHEVCIFQSSIHNRQSTINWGGGADISSLSGEKAWGQKETFVKYRQSQR